MISSPSPFGLDEQEIRRRTMAETTAPILELDRVSKRFDRTVVADDLCLGIERGEKLGG